MQSQQKRVKWSRGETAEALEERTDTGITQASVELMENCIPDIYGNISRRPALKLLDLVYDPSNYIGFNYDEYLQVIPFYITENDYILIGIHYNDDAEMIRIVNGRMVYKLYMRDNSPHTSAHDTEYTTAFRPISYAQQNNYMLIADAYNVWKVQITLTPRSYAFTETCEVWKFSAGWYAPKGTQTRAVGKDAIPNLSFSGNFSNYIFTDSTPSSVVYSMTSTGLTINDIDTIKQYIPVGSIVQFPNNGAYLRVEGYDMGGNNLVFPDKVFDGVLNPNDAIPSTGLYCQTGVVGGMHGTMKAYRDGTLIDTADLYNQITYCVRNSGASYGLSKATLSFHNSSYHWSNWQDVPSTNVKLFIYGALLTPVADENATDTLVNVEYDYESLMPEEWHYKYTYPHPRKLTFLDQRLWAGGWQTSIVENNIYSIVIGSQIARYNDLKNDYNQQNEPITLDVLTQYKEKIVHLIDYNGLKIMTESFEYAYTNGQIVKQSSNGSFEYCEPIVFDSLCLYIDITGCQVKAMQYEFQNNIFNSTTINQLAPHDLVWYPWGMAQYEDKTHSTGKHLFLVNREDANARVAVCNFVPGNQAQIWNRWTVPKIQVHGYDRTKPIIYNVVNLKDKTLFLVLFNTGGSGAACIIPAELDFEANTDFESPVFTHLSSTWFSPVHQDTVYGTTYFVRMLNVDIAVYSNGEFQFNTTTDSLGRIVGDLTGLTNITVGLPINATVRSHPIDVGGKTKTIKKRIGKSVLSVHNTEPNAININGKTGYMNPQNDKINFYGITGMKDEIKYILTNKNGAKFTIESLTMNVEYGTLIS